MDAVPKSRLRTSELSPFYLNFGYHQHFWLYVQNFDGARLECDKTFQVKDWIANAVVPANEKVIVPRDIAVAISDGTSGRITTRSGLAAKHHLAVGAGVIDTDYRRKVKVFLFNY